ncbi:MAG: UDP-N-acetylglucosamine 1-carboxyvinyltransferase [Alphaproteobacteria bacterium]|jgi:UDP-N-acetylglucosamine 1-carboxyvinyltransferase|nr:UDP-N-acetylglucosamine 1-carboxyvinyltransferase [Alphaproteobacteria bacterium]MBT4019774.1 UDP-N-acetylglucosamine 1-carboxyvinyltransferase [Alphaproteobacteria bacterium]MBT5158172.1 UDP-N-acetylglucosamine 1-carboxyvinyltransferase [Alphaproteobacteria bacterium]MBT5919499.1 UDP-N-acetylglucosamine 1-carboxyvinyltransferase [Alphaproteobacteria bacterium]MBT6387842.1 UDP-N-acetylglucosamine 1-carboxyvinyltransferase [Alphaproteobacteria bacterium]
MDQIRIVGGGSLKGTIAISGAKNAALPLMAACLLTEGTLRLANIPHLADISTTVHLLAQLGVTVTMNGDAEAVGGAHGYAGRVLSLTAAQIASTTADYELVRKMRASVLVLGPLLAREHEARVSLPGGCAIGTRPVDIHLAALEELGAEIKLEDGYIVARAPGGLRGGTVRFPQVSVGATENLLMAASLAKGETVLENAAREPEITDLAQCLIAMGAEIEGLGSDRLVIQGKPTLGGADYSVMPDRIETGTYMAAAALTGGDLTLTGTTTAHLGAVVEAMERTGVEINDDGKGKIRAWRTGEKLQATDVTTLPYPAFPTDMQAQFMAIMATANGASLVTETIFENRFMHVPELTRMGADITINGNAALVRGVARLKGAPVMATDLRASVSLVLAGLAAEGETVISRVYHLDRGYERLVEKLAACGANIERIRE